MKKSHFLLILTLICGASPLFSQGKLGKSNSLVQYNSSWDVRGATPGGGAYQQNVYQNATSYASFQNDSVMEIGSRVLMNVPADGYIVIFSLTQVGVSLAECNSLMDERINGFKTSLERVGISENNIKIDIISQVPTFEYEVEKKLFSKYAQEVPSGFELKKNVHIYYSQSNLINKILETAAANEIYEISRVEFVINDVQAVYDTLRQVAAADILSKRKVYETLGIKFNPLFQVVSEDISSVSPEERYKSMESYSDQPLPSGTRKFDRTKKDVSWYYARVGYVDFDQYLNPQQISPSMQFICHLKVRYSLKRQ
ncbi:MAG: SIMPL domain-containing protein [Bacteroidia bacterium]|nr:SIMPL domain-containing protein [Bacteroidia bacterium]